MGGRLQQEITHRENNNPSKSSCGRHFSKTLMDGIPLKIEGI